MILLALKEFYAKQEFHLIPSLDLLGVLHVQYETILQAVTEFRVTRICYWWPAFHISTTGATGDTSVNEQIQ